MAFAKKTLATILLVAVGATSFTTSARAQRLFGLASSSGQLRILEPADATNLQTLGTVTHPDGIDQYRGLAVQPSTGVLYTVLYLSNGQRVLGTLDLQANFSQIGLVAAAVRDMTFDASGKLWAVNGVVGPSGNALISIDTVSAAVTEENTSLPTSRNKLAYVPAQDRLYLLGDAGSSWNLFSFAPTAPTTLTPVPLTGAPLSGMSQPPVVYDEVAQALRTFDGAGQWIAIGLDGLASVAAGFPGVSYGGLAFEWMLFGDGFESGDLTSWTASTP